jgi:hypothetical protein
MCPAQVVSYPLETYGGLRPQAPGYFEFLRMPLAELLQVLASPCQVTWHLSPALLFQIGNNVGTGWFIRIVNEAGRTAESGGVFRCRLPAYVGWFD